MATKDTSKRALVVVDVQNEYISGNFLITYPDPKVSMANILAAMDAAKKAGIPVITVQHSLPAGAPIFAADSDNFKLHPDVAARDVELNLVKGNASSFSGTELKSFLESKNIGTVAVIGYMTHNCVDSTVREAAHKGYEVEVLADACGSLPYANKAGEASAEVLHNATLTVLSGFFANVVSTTEWIGAVEKGTALSPKDNIVASNANALAKGLK